MWVAVAGHADEFTVDNHHLASKVGEGTKSEITVRPQVADRHCLVLDPLNQCVRRRDLEDRGVFFAECACDARGNQILRCVA